MDIKHRISIIFILFIFFTMQTGCSNQRENNTDIEIRNDNKNETYEYSKISEEQIARRIMFDYIETATEEKAKPDSTIVRNYMEDNKSIKIKIITMKDEIKENFYLINEYMNGKWDENIYQEMLESGKFDNYKSNAVSDKKNTEGIILSEDGKYISIDKDKLNFVDNTADVCYGGRIYCVTRSVAGVLPPDIKNYSHDHFIVDSVELVEENDDHAKYQVYCETFDGEITVGAEINLSRGDISTNQNNNYFLVNYINCS